jgi:hypothetical protein
MKSTAFWDVIQYNSEPDVSEEYITSNIKVKV